MPLGICAVSVDAAAAFAGELAVAANDEDLTELCSTSACSLLTITTGTNADSAVDDCVESSESRC
ncbi:hypothetical protein J2778_004855 [Paraburkholderia graminis]|jgi:hypothetical protein|nr:hypothetical protein [Paraburkholderia graminis]